MRTLSSLISSFTQAASPLRMLLVDTLHVLRLCLRSPTALAAENLFLRKQLTLYQERLVKPQHATNAIRITLTWLARWFDWRQAFVVQPATLLRWHRQGFRMFWRGKSRRGRPPIPANVQALIRQMAYENPTWGLAALHAVPIDHDAPQEATAGVMAPAHDADIL